MVLFLFSIAALILLTNQAIGPQSFVNPSGIQIIGEENCDNCYLYGMENIRFDRTINVWFKCNANQITSPQYLYYVQGTYKLGLWLTNDLSHAIRMTYAGGQATTSFYNTNPSNPGEGQLYDNSLNAVCDNSWHTITIRRKTTSPYSIDLYGYFDGNFVHKTGYSAGLAFDISKVSIGSNNEANIFSGELTGFQVYEGSLSDTQIRNLYQQGTPPQIQDRIVDLPGDTGNIAPTQSESFLVTLDVADVAPGNPAYFTFELVGSGANKTKSEYYVYSTMKEGEQ